MSTFIETTTTDIKNKLLEYHLNNTKNDNYIEKITLPKGTILYRSDIDICDFKKKKKCLDTGKSGIYFSDNVMIPFGMSFEYKNKFDLKISKKAGGSFFGEGKETFFKEHQIGVFKTTEDIEFYLHKYSYRKTALGGKGYDDYSQSPKKNINHVDLIRPIIYGENDSYYNNKNRDEQFLFELLFNTNNIDFLEFFIAEDEDLEKIQFVEATIFDINNFKKKAMESFNKSFNEIFNYFSNEYIITLPKIHCEEGDGAIKKKSKKKKWIKKSKKSKSKNA